MSYPRSGDLRIATLHSQQRYPLAGILGATREVAVRKSPLLELPLHSAASAYGGTQ